MPRWIGMLFIALSAGLIFNGVEAQEPSKKGPLDVEAIFKKLDLNRDNMLTKDEFVKLAERFKDKEKALEKLKKAYNQIDPDNKGVSKDVFRKYFENVRKKDEN